MRALISKFLDFDLSYLGAKSRRPVVHQLFGSLLLAWGILSKLFDRKEEFVMKSVSLVALATFATVCQTVLAGYNTIPSKYSNNSIRVKSWAANDDSLCDGGAPHYTGWADIRDRHLFFCKTSLPDRHQVHQIANSFQGIMKPAMERPMHPS